MSKLLTERKFSYVQRAWKMKALPWCCSSTEAFTPTCGLTSWPVSREQGEYKKTAPTKAYFLKESLPRCFSHIFTYCLLKKICKRLVKWSGKTVNFAFRIEKNCISIYSSYLCIFSLYIWVHPGQKLQGWESCACLIHSSFIHCPIESNGSKARNFASDFSTFLARQEPCAVWLSPSAPPGTNNTLHVKYFIPWKNWKCTGTVTASPHEQLGC